MGLYRDNGQENGSYYSIWGVGLRVKDLGTWGSGGFGVQGLG